MSRQLGPDDQIDWGEIGHHFATGKFSQPPAESVSRNVCLPMQRDNESDSGMPEIVGTPADVHSGSAATASSANNSRQF